MPRSGEVVRRRLQMAALELFSERGYEETTAAEIAARAGVTERTFFRHFPDKREVLFDGDAAFTQALRSAVRYAPAALGPWDALFLAFGSVKHMFVENRPFSEPRQRVIAGSPALQERAAAKTRSMIAALASALCERGVPARQANLAAQMGAITLGHAVAAWFDDAATDLGVHIARAVHEVREVSSSSTDLRKGEPTKTEQADPKRPGKAKRRSRRRSSDSRPRDR
jgi:AcrR family transcriptional regulator